MKRSRRSPWSLPTWQGLSTWAGCVLLLSILAGCSRERQSAVAIGGDSAQASAADNTAIQHDTAITAQQDTATATPSIAKPVAPADTATKASKPASKKPAAPKPAAPVKPQPAETTTTAASPADTTASSPTQTEASAPLRDQYHSAPLDTVSQDVYNGWKQFNLNCARCHGEDVQGTTIAPHLIVSLKPDGPINTKELFVQTVCAGRPVKGMPSWCALGMDMEKINQIYSYVKGRSDAKIHPGRPAVKSGG
jgi:mono/diheme cytochrome c family protein